MQVELIANRKAKEVHRRLEGKFTSEQCNVDDMTDFMILDEGYLNRLIEQGYRECLHCKPEETPDEYSPGD